MRNIVIKQDYNIEIVRYSRLLLRCSSIFVRFKHAQIAVHFYYTNGTHLLLDIQNSRTSSQQ